MNGNKKRHMHFSGCMAVAGLIIGICSGCGDNTVGLPPAGRTSEIFLTPEEKEGIASRARDEVKKLSESEWPEVRKAAIELLAAYPDSDVFARAAQMALSDTNPEVRAAAVAALKESNDGATEMLLMRALRDQSALVHKAALATLYDRGRKDNRDKVLEMLQDDLTGSDAERRLYVLTFLAERPDVKVSGWTVPEAGTAAERLLSAVILLNQEDYSGVKLLMSSALEENLSVRSQTARVMGYLTGNPRFAEAILKQLLVDKDSGVRQSAAMSARRLKIASLTPLVERMLHQESTAERVVAAKTLGEMGTVESALLLWKAGLDGDAEALIELARNAEKADGAPIRKVIAGRCPALTRAMTFHTNDMYRIGALRVFVTVGEGSYLTDLETLALVSPLPRVKMVGIEGLSIHGDRHSVARVQESLFSKAALKGKKTEQERLHIARALLVLTKAIPVESVPLPDYE
ncbi:MAG: HEAT repeat domain-containing protein [Planctomycetes bacterium]|nr:HEAT repeat domain-containing protein [Planctomycetota bacterium]